MTENEVPEQTQPLIVRVARVGPHCGERYAAPAQFIDAAEIVARLWRMDRNTHQRGWYEQRKERSDAA